MSVAIPSLRGAIAVPEWAKNELWRKAQVVPSLDLRFADFKSLVDAVTGTNLIDFTRASGGTYVGSDGLIKTAATNEPRFDHDHTTGESLGLLVEEQRTNFILNSSPATTGFALSGAVADTVSGVLAPDGQLYTVRRVTYPSTGAWRFGDTVSGTAGTTYTGSVWMKTESGTANMLLDVNDATQKPVTVTQNWQRLDATGVHATDPYRFFDISGGTGQVILFWGAQLEEGSEPSSYIPTEGSQVTRAGDVASISGANFSSWYRQDEGTAFIDSASFGDAASIARSIFAATDGSTGNRVELLFNASDDPQFLNVSGGVITASPGSPTIVSSLLGAQSSIAYRQDDFALCADGAAAVVDTSGAVALGVNQLTIGSRLSSLFLNGTVRRIAFWPQRLSNEILQVITQ